jgi:hypothetical protein
MRVLIAAAAFTGALLAVGLGHGAAARGCTLPPRTVRAELDAKGARYEWTTTCGGARVVIRASYDERTNRTSEVVVFPARRGATNTFEAWCGRNPWAPDGRPVCAELHKALNVPSAFTEPWLGRAELRETRSGLPARVDNARAGAPIPLLPPSGTILARDPGAPVELRWTSGTGPTARYRVELQRGISASGPFSEVRDATVDGTAGLSVGYRIPPEVITTNDARSYWRWRVGQATDAGAVRYSTWQSFSLR